MVNGRSGSEKESILIVGSGKVAFSLVVCLIQAGYPITLFTKNRDIALKSINFHLADLPMSANKFHLSNYLKITNELSCKIDFKLVIVLTDENLLEKRTLIKQLENKLPPNSLIAINTESIPLANLQEGCNYPDRVLGANWVEPVHTTYFLELITNCKSNEEQINYLFNLAKTYWNKDPYIINNTLSIRAKMFAAMAREAFYLVQNGYASIEDIDRACRNDAGYYLPFAGNFRYMDLMGGSAYGMVMKDLNPELSKEHKLPEFFKNILEQGGLGMENNKGFYQYDREDVDRWDTVFRMFSYQMQEIISKYPFNYKNKNIKLNGSTESDDK